MSFKKSAALVGGVVFFASGVAVTQPLFAPPQNLGPKINTSFYESDPFWDGPRSRLYFVSTRDGAEDIWFSEWTDTGWTSAEKVNAQINRATFQHSPSIAPDGQKLFYVESERGGGFWDIWVSTWDSSLNDWGTSQSLGPPVNTLGTEFSAHIGPDGRHLYFTSFIFYDPDPDSLTRCGVYVSEWDGNNWSKPVQFAPNLNTCFYVGESPSITADSFWFYFDNFVNDGQSNFVSHWNGSLWEPPVDLRPQIGGRGSGPSVTASGDSLFFGGATIDLGGFGSSDIFLMPRIVLGDLNLDGQLTTTDVVLELNSVFLGDSFPAPPASADCNCDGGLSPADVVLLLNATFLGKPFPCRI
jgi:WD40 repeat protein